MNKRGKEVDTTSLSLEQANIRGWIHRDYLAHVLRWQHVVKKVRHDFAKLWILDVGCGKEAPLPFTLFSNQLNHKKGAGGYVGVDFGKTIEPHRYLQNAIDRATFNAHFYPKYDFAKNGVTSPVFDKDVPDAFNVAVCFEVVEHVEPYTSYLILKQIANALAPGGVAYVSTPVYDPKSGAADNHVNEMSYQAMEYLINAADLRVVEAYGTFASQKDIKPRLEENGYRALFDQLTAYHDSNVLANLFAPLYPQASRNVLWTLASHSPWVYDPAAVKALDTPSHSSSDRWSTDLKRIAKESALWNREPKPPARTTKTAVSRSPKVSAKTRATATSTRTAR